MFEPIVILVTASNKTEAEKIAKALLEQKLIACSNLVDGVRSLFWWEGKIEDQQEVMMILKSERSLFSKVEAVIKSLHSYQVPEIISMPVVESHQGYLEWMQSWLKG